MRLTTRHWSVFLETIKTELIKVVSLNREKEEPTLKLEMIIIIDFDFKCQLHQLQAQIVQVRLHQQVTKSLTLTIEGTS